MRTRGVQWKYDDSIEHYVTQMLLAINWRYWQAVKKNSRMRMKFEGRLMEAYLIEIHQVLAKKGYFFQQNSMYTYVSKF